jgi:hypothetical protein
MTGLGRALETHRTAQAAEIACVFLVAVVVISVGWRVIGSNLVARQAVVWIANILMLVAVWIGLRVRGQTWESMGLPFRFGGFARWAARCCRRLSSWWSPWRPSWPGPSS